MRPCSALIMMAFLALSGACATRALADPAASQSVAANSDSLEEIQVVAQKQNIDLQKAPVAIAQHQNILRISELE